MKNRNMEKEKYTLSKESIQRSKDVYGIVNLSELQPVHLYNIQTINAHGYAVIDNNVSLQEQKKGVKKNCHSVLYVTKLHSVVQGR